MRIRVSQLLVDAHKAVQRITPDEARRLIVESDALLVDVRDRTEVVKTGKIKGAVHISRRQIPFRADPMTPYHHSAFRKDRPVIVYCGSSGRSALAGKALKDMGYSHVFNLGSFDKAIAAGLETEPARELRRRG